MSLWNTLIPAMSVPGTFLMTIRSATPGSNRDIHIGVIKVKIDRASDIARKARV